MLDLTTHPTTSHPTTSHPTDRSIDRDGLASTVVASIHAMADLDAEALRRTVHPEATNREALAEPPATRGQGPEAFLATAEWLADAFSDLAFDLTTVMVEGDLVVTHGTMSGRQTGPFVIWDADERVERAFAPTGRTFSVHQAHFCRMRDGLVVEHWAVRDDQGMAIQLGWIPPSPWYLVRCARATRAARRAAR